MKRFSTVSLFLIAFVAIISLSECHANTANTARNPFWSQQYQELEQGIATRKIMTNSAAKEIGVLDTNALILSTDHTSSDVLIRRTIVLLQAIKKHHATPKILELEKKLNALKSENNSKGLAKSTAASTADNDLFMKISALNKEIALTNPLIDFDSLLFVGYALPHVRHMCDQFYPWNFSMGGGLYILKGIKSGDVTLVDVLQNSKCVNGSFKGSNLAGGAFYSPDLSFDGKTIVFAWSTSGVNACYHLFKVDIDGSNLTQLTDGSSNRVDFLSGSKHNDFDPAWLPDGRIAFISDRRGGYVRGGNSAKPTFTLHSMKDDGSDIICLSNHEANEWSPSVNNQGMIVYTRWDYIDRDECIAQHLWICYPDGRDPRSWHGNYPLPIQTFTGSYPFRDGRFDRPFAEFNIRAIPGSFKYIATAGPHHGLSFGDLILINPDIEDDGKVSQVERITTALGTDWKDNTQGPYGTAWPLSEDYYICNKDSSIVLRDRFGGEQEIYKSSSWWPVYPIPVKARTKPPVLPTATWQGERENKDHYRATIGVLDVYSGDIPLPANTKIKSLRIVEVFPKETALLNEPRNGYPSEALTRMSLGTVPVESDGSVYCEAPVGKTLYFQLLDENGLAVQSMRSATYVHEGEQLSCVGCHENKWKAYSPKNSPIAFKRAPSTLTPDAGGVEPVNFYRLVKPVFDKNCTPCHTEKGIEPDMTFKSLNDYAFYFCDQGWPYLNGDIIAPYKGGSRTTPGKFGAAFSKLINYIDGSHHNATLTTDEYKRVALWLDLNSMELGAEYKLTEQQSGQLVWPRMDVDSTNPQGIEKNYPVKISPMRVLNNKQNGQIRVYRNGSVISITHPEVAFSGASVFDLSGRCIHKWRFDKETRSFNFDMRAYPMAKGTYIFKTTVFRQMEVNKDDNTFVKFVIQ